MNYFLIQAILVAAVGDEDSRFWIQILIFLLLAAAWGVYSFVKNDLNKRKFRQQNLDAEASDNYAKSRWRFQLPRKPDFLNFSHEQGHDLDNLPGNRTRDLQSGMELLELDFLLSVVENTKGNAKNDVTMRKLNFNEVFRREKLSRVNSKVLTVYAVDRRKLYGKDVQCKAMQELAKRTARMIKDQPILPLLSINSKETMARVK